MALLERVTTLLRANLNDLLDQAEDPEKLLKQVILDMENQLLQVKTEVAIAIAEQHVLGDKRAEHEDHHGDWMRRAELAVDKKDDDLARAALARATTHRELAERYGQHAHDHGTEVERLKKALRQLDQKLTEARARADVLIAQHRRARAMRRTARARSAGDTQSHEVALERLGDKVRRADASSRAEGEVADDDLERRLDSLAREDDIERLLAELKARRR